MKPNELLIDFEEAPELDRRPQLYEGFLSLDIVFSN